MKTCSSVLFVTIRGYSVLGVGYTHCSKSMALMESVWNLQSAQLSVKTILTSLRALGTQLVELPGDRCHPGHVCPWTRHWNTTKTPATDAAQARSQTQLQQAMTVSGRASRVKPRPKKGMDCCDKTQVNTSVSYISLIIRWYIYLSIYIDR